MHPCFYERDDGYPEADTMILNLAMLKAWIALMYQAVVQGEVDVISGFATDYRMAAFGLIILEDDHPSHPMMQRLYQR